MPEHAARERRQVHAPLVELIVLREPDRALLLGRRPSPRLPHDSALSDGWDVVSRIAGRFVYHDAAAPARVPGASTRRSEHLLRSDPRMLVPGRISLLVQQL